MKEIRMDYETYQYELERSRRRGFSGGLWKVAQWLNGKESLAETIKCDPDQSYGYICLAKLLGREDEISEDPDRLTKEEVA